MRMVLGAMVVAMGMAAQPAFAGEGAPPPVTPVALPSFTMPMLADIAPALPDLRLPTVAIAAPERAVAIDDQASSLRRRFTGGRMMEYYPFGGSGFHLSAGTRLFARRNFATETTDSARGALSVSRSIMAPMVTRSGFRKFNPAVTAGYAVALSKVAQIGVEGGAMMTRAFAGTPGLSRTTFGSGGEAGFHPNAVANMVFGLHF